MPESEEAPLVDPREVARRLAEVRHLEDPRRADLRLADLRLVDPRLVEPHLVVPRLVDPQLVDPRLVDPRRAELLRADLRLVDPQLVELPPEELPLEELPPEDPRRVERLPVDPRLVERLPVDPRLVEPLPVDPHLEDPHLEDPRLVELLPVGRRLVDPHRVEVPLVEVPLAEGPQMPAVPPATSTLASSAERAGAVWPRPSTLASGLAALRCVCRLAHRQDCSFAASTARPARAPHRAVGFATPRRCVSRPRPTPIGAPAAQPNPARARHPTADLTACSPSSGPVSATRSLPPAGAETSAARRPANACLAGPRRSRAPNVAQLRPARPARSASTAPSAASPASTSV
jgi:hypothetical protein